MAELVTVSIKNHVADVRLNRPEKYNAFSIEMFNALADVIKRLSKELEVRAVVLSGEGKGFCAGLDVERFQKTLSSDKLQNNNSVERYEDQITNLYQFVSYGWRQLPVPVIAAIHGAAFGAGCEIALGADIRLATPDARFSIMEIKWGLIPDMATSQTLREIMSIDVAKELVFTGKIISGTEASQLNLVTRTCENPYDEAMALANEIACKNPHAVRAAKTLLNESWHDVHPEAGLMMESEMQMTLKSSPNQLEAISANFDNRKPEFENPK